MEIAQSEIFSIIGSIEDCTDVLEAIVPLKLNTVRHVKAIREELSKHKDTMPFSQRWIGYLRGQDFLDLLEVEKGLDMEKIDFRALLDEIYLAKEVLAKSTIGLNDLQSGLAKR